MAPTEEPAQRPPRDNIVWDWNANGLTSGQLARKYGMTKGQVLGIIHRDPRAKPRRATVKTTMTLSEAVDRLRRLEAQVRRLVRDDAL